MIFSEANRPYEAFIQVVKLEDNKWQPVRSETISCINSDSLEQEISWWRRRYQMTSDLVEKPGEIFQIAGGPQILDGAFVHVVQLKPDLSISYYYHLTAVGPRLLAADLGSKLDIGDAIFVPRDKPPAEITTYARPFGTAIRQ